MREHLVNGPVPVHCSGVTMVHWYSAIVPEWCALRCTGTLVELQNCQNGETMVQQVQLHHGETMVQCTRYTSVPSCSGDGVITR